MNETLKHNDYIYTVVTEPPLGYEIWNIGDHAPEGYLPFCRLSVFQPFSGARCIEVDTLKAIKCEGAKLILAAIGFGPQTSAEMQKYISKNKSKKNETWICERMEKAIPYLKAIGL